MTDVIHDPRTDWCACEPGGTDLCAYRMLADTVVERLNPRDGDEAEVSLCMAAVENAAAFIEAQPCYCLADYPDIPCPRCRVLGQWRGKPVDQ
jgi:hypothetical protein